MNSGAFAKFDLKAGASRISIKCRCTARCKSSSQVKSRKIDSQCRWQPAHSRKRKKAKGWLAWPKAEARIKWQMPNGILTCGKNYRSSSRSKRIQLRQPPSPWDELGGHRDTGMGELTRGNCVAEMQWKITVEPWNVWQLRKNWHGSAASGAEGYGVRAQFLTTLQISSINALTLVSTSNVNGKGNGLSGTLN